MKTRMVEERIGEDMGLIDWSYNFRQHFDSYGSLERHREERCAEAIAWLRALTEGEWDATTDGGWPRIGWHRVIRVAMYDGWPYWRPVPSVLTEGVLGPEWHPFHSVTGILKRHA